MFHKSLFQSQMCWRIRDPHPWSFADGKNVVCMGWVSSLTSGIVFDSSHWPQFVHIGPQKILLQQRVVSSYIIPKIKTKLLYIFPVFYSPTRIPYAIKKKTNNNQTQKPTTKKPNKICYSRRYPHNPTLNILQICLDSPSGVIDLSPLTTGRT